MGFFEWIGELINPGPVGRIDGRNENEAWQPRRKAIIWLMTMLGVGLLAFFIWALFQTDAWWQWLIGLAVYLLVSYSITPQPDHRNMGWFGGVIDNPFRISDDLNRFAALLGVLLFPGKIIVYALQTIINTILTFRSKN